MSDQFKVGDKVWHKRNKWVGAVHGVAGLWLWVDLFDGRQPMTILADEMTTVDPNKRTEPPLGVSIAARRQFVLEAIVDLARWP